MCKKVGIQIPKKLAKKIEVQKIDLSQAITFFLANHDPSLLNPDASPKTPQRRV